MLLALLFLPLIALSGDFVFFKQSAYDEIFEELRKARVIYLGEVHDSRKIHLLQFRIIMDLLNSGEKILITMEAFQQQFQKHIDEYLAGEIEEEELLERTEYKKRWRFEPSLYAPFWRLARDRGIPLYALNIPSELIREVKEKGIEKVKSQYLPREIIPFNQRHRDFLAQAMEDHDEVDEQKFLDVQLAWDNGMAYRITKLLLAHPDRKIVVIVGSGHVWRGWGIPERVSYMVGNLPQAVLYTEEDEVYFLFSKDFSKEASSTNSSSEPN
jgi:uncharacterized iron-regulated protein